MRTVGSIKQALEMFPDDAEAYAYEGEGTGLVIAGGGFIEIPQAVVPPHRDLVDVTLRGEEILIRDWRE